MRWSENQTYQFVKIYLSHEYLWNPEHINYRSKSKRARTYKEIILALKEATGISLNETELKIKIKNLRSTYLQEVRKIQQRSDSEWTYKPNMKWFADWHRCLGGERKKTEDSDNLQDISDDQCQKVWLAQNGDNTEEETLEEPFTETDDEYNIVLKTEPREVCHINAERPFRRTESSENRYESKKKKNKKRSISTDGSSFRGSTDNVGLVTKEDEFEIYGKYIASQLRRMDLQKALRVQLEIQSLVSEARISDMNGKH